MKLKLAALIVFLLSALTPTLHPEDIPTPDEIFDIIHKKITYKAEAQGMNIIQPPVFTIKYRSGDCEDFALLYLDSLHYYYNIEGYLLRLESKAFPGSFHIVVIEPGCKYVKDPTSGWKKTLDEVVIDWIPRKLYTYREYLGLAFSYNNLQLLSAYERELQRSRP